MKMVGGAGYVKIWLIELLNIRLVSLLLLISFTSGILNNSALAQEAKEITITGTVKDQHGETIIGANVVIKGTTQGTITDFDGKYVIKAKSTDELQFSFIGFRMKTISINGKMQIDVVLEEESTDLEEVVVVGYGEVKRANLVGSVASISADELEDIPVTSLSNLLEGRLSGVSVSPAQPTGNPGASTRITIRATTTFGTSGGGAKDPTPLYIVDGFEVSQEEYDVLDPSEIESFSVLKDASAAVYGSKGANGVVLVKTKRGKEGKLKVSYSGSHGIMDATMHTDMLSAYDHARAINARYIDDPDKQMSDTELEAMKNVENYEWLDEIWQKSSISRHTLNFSGGTKKVKYFAGGTYIYTEGNFPSLDVGKYSYRLGLDAQITDELSVSATVSYDNKDFKRPYISGAGSNTMEDLFEELLQAPKWTPAYINGYPVGNNLSFNPMYLFESNSYRQSVNKGNTMNLRASYNLDRLTKGLKASATYSRRENHSYSKDYMVPYYLYDFKTLGEDYIYILGDEIQEPHYVENNNRISESYGSGSNYQLNLSLNYNRKFGLHNVSSFLTYEQSENSGFDFLARSENIETYGLEIQDAFQTKFTDGSMSEGGDLGAVLRMNYSYADKYLLESTFRYETTTKFAPGERDGLFPSVSVGWVASEEDFFKRNLSPINFFKLRYSWGITGYGSVSAYEYNLQYALASNRYLLGGDSPVGGIGISGKSDVASTGVSWEKSMMNNLGIDMKMLDNKLSLSLDAYYTYQYDILTQRTVDFPETAGLGQMPGENLGRLEAWGYDMSIGYKGRINKDAYWNISGIFGYSTNRILETPTKYNPVDFRYPVGQSTSAAGREEGLICHGIIRNQEQLDAINAEWNEKWGHGYQINGEPAGLGSLHFEDIAQTGNIQEDGTDRLFEPDGNITSDDMTYLERAGDKLSWKHILPSNISLGGGWKNIKMSMLFSFAYGTTNKAVDKLARTAPTDETNAPAFWSDFWTLDNPDAKYPSPVYAESNQWVSTFWMKDVYQVRLKNLNISYTLPKEMSQKWGIPDLRIFFAGTNLWTPVSTFDYKEDAIARFNTYPLLRTFSLGVNVKL